jgi:hypothetical protein
MDAQGAIRIIKALPCRFSSILQASQLIALPANPLLARLDLVCKHKKQQHATPHCQPERNMHMSSQRDSTLAESKEATALQKQDQVEFISNFCKHVPPTRLEKCTA